jgi:hypothetical protein
MTLISFTPAAAVTKGRVDFNKSGFDKLVWDKGYAVIHEKALKCPCVSKNTNQQSNCHNCGGVGWIFVNATETRMVISSMNMTTKFSQWSETNMGTASITALAETETSYMDRLTVLDANTIFGEVLFLKQYGSTYYFATIYDIKSITSLALFINVNSKLKQLAYGIDFTYSGNKIMLLNPTDFIDPLVTEQDISISIRYVHAPQMHIIDSTRDTLQSFVMFGDSDQAVNLPIHSVARRAHYVLTRENFDNSRLVNNDFTFNYNDLNPPLNIC